MKEKTKRIIATIAAEQGITPRRCGTRNDGSNTCRHGFARSTRTSVVEANVSRWKRAGLGYLSRLYGKPRGYDDG